MESRMLDLPLPLRPVIELKLSSLLKFSMGFVIQGCKCIPTILK